MDTEAYIESLTVFNTWRESTMRNAIKLLNLPLASKGIDVGCGVGLQTLILAEQTGPEGKVTGLDIEPAFLNLGGKIIEEAGMSDQISFKEGSADNIPFEDNTFDWAWSSDCVGYAPWDPIPILKELKRVVKPSGVVALVAWSSEQLLPGYPHMEALLKATSAGIAPFMKDKEPEKHFLRATGWFRELGFKDIKADVFSAGAHAPLSPDFRKALISLFEMRWPGVEEELSEKEVAEFHRLCKPESPDFILNHPDYYAFFTYSMFWGKVGE